MSKGAWSFMKIPVEFVEDRLFTPQEWILQFTALYEVNYNSCLVWSYVTIFFSYQEAQVICKLGAKEIAWFFSFSGSLLCCLGSLAPCNLCCYLVLVSVPLLIQETILTFRIYIYRHFGCLSTGCGWVVLQISDYNVSFVSLCFLQ